MNRTKHLVKAILAGTVLTAVLFSTAISQENPSGSTQQNDAPSVGGIPGETIDEGKQFVSIKLDQYVSDPNDKPETILWSASGNKDLKVTIANRIATITTPNTDWNGTESVTFTAKDPKGAMGAETVTFTVISINDAPVIKKIPDQSINEGSTFQNIKLDDYISDVDHPVNQIQWSVDLQMVSKVSAEGELTVKIDGNRIASIVQPDTNWFGAYKATFTATDGEGASVSTSAIFTVNPVNDPPILQAVPDQTIEEGGDFEVINLTSLASDADDDVNTLKWSVQGGNQLKATIDKYNVLSLKAPNKDWNGPVETFVVTAKDPKGGQASLTMKFLVKSVNDEPEIGNIPSQSIDEGKSFQPIDLSKYTTDIDHRFDQLKWVFTGAKNLRAQLAGTNLNISVIDTNWHGEETITAKVEDPEKGKAETQISFTVRSVNDLPFIGSIADQAIDEGKQFATVKLDDFVIDGDHKDEDLSWDFQVKSASKNNPYGEPYVNMDGKRIASIVLPDTNYNGAFTVTYTVSDPEGAKASKVVNYVVRSVNDLPVLKKIADQSVDEGNDFNSVNLDELVSDSDHDIAQLKWAVSGNQKLLASIDKNRVLTVKAPDSEYYGPTEEIVVTATDPEGGVATTKARFSVKSVNDAPEMKDIPSQSIKEGQSFKPLMLDDIVTDLDHRDDQIKWTFTGNKQLKITMDGRVAKIMIPDTNWHGEETITFTATDPENAKTDRTATFTVESVNDIPALTPIPAQTITEGKQFTAIKLDDFVVDADHKDDILNWEANVSKQKGAKGSAELRVEIDAARVARIIIPDTNWNGAEEVTFTVTDPEGARKSSTTLFTVTSVNDLPTIAKIEDQTIDEGGEFAAINLDSYVNDSDHPKDKLRWTIEGGNLLTASVDKNRQAIIRIPNKEWSGNPETFRFTVTDPEGGTATASVKFTVKAVNDPPILKEIPSQRIKEGESFKVIALDSYVSDVDNDPAQLKWSLKGNKSIKAVLNAAREVTLSVPDSNWHGEESLTFSVSDGVAQAERTAIFTVTSVNDVPQVVKPLVGQEIDEGKKFASINLNDLVQDLDHKDSEINWTASSVPVGAKKGAVGVLQVNIENGVATISVPDTNWYGAEVITFEGRDPEGAKVSLSATFTVKSINDLPSLGKIADQSINEKESFSAIALGELISDSDHSKDKLKIDISGNKDLKINLDKALNATIVTPSVYWNGTEKITVTVTDPDGGKTSQSFTLTAKSVNDLPEINGFKGQTIAEGKEFTAISLDALVKDNDHAKDQLKWTVSGQQELKATIDGSRVLTLRAPNENWHGMETITITVTDPDKGKADAQASFVITSVNDLPVLKEIPAQTINEGGKFTSIKLSNLVTDADHKFETLVWSASVESVKSEAPAKTTKAPKEKKSEAKGPVSSGNLSVVFENGEARIEIPDEDWHGERKIVFTVTDPEGGKASTSTVFTVRSVNDVPVLSKNIQGASFSVNEGEPFQPIQLGTMVTDADHSLESLTWSVEGAKQCKVNISKEAVLTVVAPSAEWSGKEVLSLTVKDPDGGKADTKLSFEVKPVNDPPYLGKFEGQSIKEGQSFKIINLDDLVKDPDDKPTELTWTVSGNKSLVANVGRDRILKITAPDENWHGEEAVTIKVQDKAGASATATATFTIASVNDAPVLAEIPSQRIKEGGKFTVINLDALVKDADHKPEQLTWTATISGGKGAPAKAAPKKPAPKKPAPKGKGKVAEVSYPEPVTVGDLRVEISPDRKATIIVPSEDWNGERTIIFTVTDPEGAKDSKTADFEVESVNDAPVLGKISDLEIDEGSNFAPVSLNGLVKDVDHSISKLKWEVLGTKELKASVSGGVLTVTTPNKDWFGKEALEIIVMDPEGGKASQRVQFTVKPVNDVPVMTDYLKNQTVKEGTPFEMLDMSKAATDVDNKDNELTWSDAGSKNLKVEYNKAKNLYRVQPVDPEWNGSEEVTFIVTDPGKASASKKVNFTIQPVNDPPTISKIDDQIIKEGESFKPIDLTKFVKDPDHKLESLMFTLDDATPVFRDAKGRPLGAAKKSTAKHAIRFYIDDKGILNAMVPDEDWFGTEMVKVTVWDADKASASINVKFSVTPVNDSPNIIGAIEDMVIDEGKAFKPIKLDNLVNDVDHKKHELKWTASGNTRLDVMINSGREALVKPKRPDWFGQERITFTVTDPAGAKADVSAMFTVNHVNAAPELRKIPDQTVNEDTPFKGINMDLMVTDKDHNKSELKWSVTGNKELVVDIDKVRGEIMVKAPREHWFGGPETLTFTVTDPEGAKATTTANFKVLSVNDMPVVMSHSYSTREGEVLKVSKADGLLNNATDPDGDKPTECIVVERPTNGNLSLSNDGSFTYTPKPGFSGLDEFTFKARDKQGGQSRAERVEISVTFKLGEMRKTEPPKKEEPKKAEPKKAPPKKKK